MKSLSKYHKSRASLYYRKYSTAYLIILIFTYLVLINLKSNTVYVKISYKNNSNYPCLELGTYIKPIETIHFSKIPSHLIKNKSLFIKASPLPEYRCELTLANKTVVYTQLNYDTISYKVNFSFYHLTNFYYANYFNFISSNFTMYYFNDSWKIDMRKKKLIAVFDHCAAVNSDKSGLYGDIFIGTLSRIWALPKDILEKSTITFLYPHGLGLIKDLLSIMGVKEPKIYLMSKNDVVFAKNLYSVNPDFIPTQKTFMHHVFEGPIMTEMGRDLCKKFGATQQPKEYFICNRNPTTRRRFSNFDDVVRAITLRYPKINFLIYIGHEKNLRDTVIRYSRMKWAFMVNGSNCMNCVFMYKDSVVVMYKINYIDTHAIGCAACSGVFVIAYINSQYPRLLISTVVVDVNALLPYIDRSFFVLENKHF